MNIYSYTDAGGHAHQLPAGQDFTSQVQRIDTAAESAFNLGAALGSYVPCQVQHRQVDLDAYGDQLLARWGISRTVTPDPTPTVPRVCSRYDLLYVRMTQAERIALRASTDPVVLDLREALDMVERIELDGPLTVQGFAYLEALHFIAAGRAAQILA